jgi:hypothetical protein
MTAKPQNLPPQILPNAGGSFIRNGDGSLTPAAPPDAPEIVPEIAPDEVPDEALTAPEKPASKGAKPTVKEA